MSLGVMARYTVCVSGIRLRMSCHSVAVTRGTGLFATISFHGTQSSVPSPKWIA
jgi:hypothetical protein